MGIHFRANSPMSRERMGGGVLAEEPTVLEPVRSDWVISVRLRLFVQLALLNRYQTTDRTTEKGRIPHPSYADELLNDLKLAHQSEEIRDEQLSGDLVVLNIDNVHGFYFHMDPR